MVDRKSDNSFQPHPLLRNAHAQTIAATILRRKQFPYRAQQHLVDVEQGDRIVLHDDCPDTWQTDDRVVVMVHGLGGSHESAYMIRIAAKLNALGVRTFRQDLRGCGAGAPLAREPFHSGRSADTGAALQFVKQLCPGAPVALLGFSLGGNVVLKLLGELGADKGHAIDIAITVCPPIDLARSCRHLIQPRNRFYDRRFVTHLLQQYAERRRLFPDAASPEQLELPRNLWDLDAKLTAPICGFRSAEDYYDRSSAGRFLSSIRVPTKILIARDDPLVPSAQFSDANFPGNIQLCITEHGGHLGFIGRRNGHADRRWMDRRVIDWIRS